MASWQGKKQRIPALRCGMEMKIGCGMEMKMGAEWNEKE